MLGLSLVTDSAGSGSGLVLGQFESLSVAGVPTRLLSVSEPELELVGKKSCRSSRMDAVDGLNSFRDTRFGGRGTRGSDGRTVISCSDERENERERLASSIGESARIGGVACIFCLDFSGREPFSSSRSFIWRGRCRKRLVTNQPIATGIAVIKRAWKAERATSRASAGYGEGIQVENEGRTRGMADGR